MPYFYPIQQSFFFRSNKMMKELSFLIKTISRSVKSNQSILNPNKARISPRSDFTRTK